MRKLIIITGAQGTGKSRLATHLEKTEGAKVCDNALDINQIRGALRFCITERLAVIVIQKVQLLDLLKFIDRDTLTKIEYNIIDLDIVSYETI